MASDLTQIDTGKKVRVMQMLGAARLIARLESMGITRGSTIVKKSASLMRGPIVVQKGDLQVAIGYAQAKRVIVEPLE